MILKFKFKLQLNVKKAEKALLRITRGVLIGVIVKVIEKLLF